MSHNDSRSSINLLGPRALLLGLLACAALILAVDLLASALELHNLKEWFTFEGEATVPAWFNSFELLLVAALLLASARRAQLGGSRMESASLNVIAACFLSFAVDEAVAIHERLTFLLGRVDGMPSFRNGHGIWILAYAVIALFVVLLVGRGLTLHARRYPAEARRFAIGVGVWMAGGIGMEILMYLQVFTGPLQNASEEMLEMVGVAVMVWAIARALGPMELLVVPAAEPQKNSVQYTGAGVRSLEAAIESDA